MVRSVAGNLPEQVKNNQSVNTAAGNGGQKMSQYSWFTVYLSSLPHLVIMKDQQQKISFPLSHRIHCGNTGMRFFPLFMTRIRFAICNNKYNRTTSSPEPILYLFRKQSPLSAGQHLRLGGRRVRKQVSLSEDNLVFPYTTLYHLLAM